MTRSQVQSSVLPDPGVGSGIPAGPALTRVALTDVIPPSPGVVTAELADAALGCFALAQARKLAEWIGSGRELTASGVLRPVTATEACRVLGIQLPGSRLRSALDVDELMRDWTVAADAGFIVADGRHVYAAPDLTASPDPERVLNAWIRTAADEIGVPDEPCAGCLSVLHELYTSDRPLTIDELTVAVAEPTEEEVNAEPCPHCGGIHDPADLFGIGDLLGDADLLDGEDPDEESSTEHAEGTVAGLVAYGAAAVSGEDVRLTPLGSMLAAAVFEGCAPPPEADAGMLVSTIGELPPPVAWTMARPWLDARSADAAAGELLTFAEAAAGDERVAALTFAQELGTEAAQTWREWAKRPGFGAYARRWLAAQGELTAEDPADEAWLAVDALSVMLATLSEMLPPFVLTVAFQQALGNDMGQALTLLRASGHPAASDIQARLTGRLSLVPSPPGKVRGEKARGKPRQRPPASAGGGAYRLKISLRGVSKPPVWRRVVVPADMTLGELHEVIRVVMGWYEDHLHVFSTDWENYGTPDPELGFADEAGVRVRDVLSALGDKLRYTYDFGDDWEHDILLEETLPMTPGDIYPSCVAGKGACPPEDCGGIWGYAELKDILADPGHEQHQEMLEWLSLGSGAEFDPRAFSIDTVNAELSDLAAF